MSDLRTWGGSRGNRLPGSCYAAGLPVHVVLRAVGGERWFSEPGIADPVFALVCEEPETLGACLMPDHLHWVLDDCSTMAATVRRFKSLSTRRAWATGIRGRLWQRSYWDHVIRDREGLAATIRYIHHNPVRAGLVSSTRLWPYLHPRPGHGP